MIRIDRAYVLALTIIAVTITVSQFFSQKFIYDSKIDSRVVNISGRQRMLSQRISKSALKLFYTTDSIVFEKSRIELENALALWSKSYRALQYSDSALGINFIANSNLVLAYFAALNPLFEQISRSGMALTEIEFNNRKQNKWQNYLNVILENEGEFLKIMDDITFQYDKEARHKTDRLSLLEYILYVWAIILLLLEAFFIFKPALKNLKKTLYN